MKRGRPRKVTFLIDDRVVEQIALGGTANALAVFLESEIGLAFAGGLGRGLTSLSIGGPRMVAISAEAEQSKSRWVGRRMRWRCSWSRRSAWRSRVDWGGV
jgi:hypothetical protein